MGGGAARLKEFTAADVRSALAQIATSRSTKTVQMTRNSLVRVIRYPGANDLVSRNVAALITPPKGLEGPPSKSLSLQQARALIEAAEAARLHAYIVLCLLTGCRIEEARALRWDHVELDGDPDAKPPVPPHVTVWRSVRSHRDVKTQKSRRTLRTPVAVVEALRAHKAKQAEDRQLAGALWRDHELVFASAVGTPLDPSHVRRAFRKVCMAAGIGEKWSPRELRHTFVSIMSEQSVPAGRDCPPCRESATSADERIGTSLQNELHALQPQRDELHAPQTAANRALAERAGLEKGLNEATKGVTSCNQLANQFLARPKTSAGDARA